MNSWSTVGRQNPFEPRKDLIEDIHSAIQKSPHSYHGLRVDTHLRHKEGEAMKESRHWIDGDPTQGTVGGVSTYGLGDDPNHKDIHRALVGINNYPGNYLTLVGGRSYEPGEDEGEHIIRRGHAVKIW